MRAAARTLLWLYPRSWRQRYADEVGDLLGDHTIRARTLIDLAVGALDAHADRLRTPRSRWRLIAFATVVAGWAAWCLATDPLPLDEVAGYTTEPAWLRTHGYATVGIEFLLIGGCAAVCAPRVLRGTVLRRLIAAVGLVVGVLTPLLVAWPAVHSVAGGAVLRLPRPVVFVAAMSVAALVCLGALPSEDDRRVTRYLWRSVAVLGAVIAVCAVTRLGISVPSTARTAVDATDAARQAYLAQRPGTAFPTQAPLSWWHAQQLLRQLPLLGVIAAAIALDRLGTTRHPTNARTSTSTT